MEMAVYPALQTMLLLSYVDIAFILVRCDVYRMIFSMLERSQCQIHILLK